MIILFQEISEIHGSCQAKTNVNGRSLILSSKGATDEINAFKASFNGPIAAILSQNQ
jgi:hypothetical protein